MERKYYLRGLGIGIVVTAIIMGITLSGDKAMTDNEIIARAKELGMVENSVLSKPSDEEETPENAEETPEDAEEMPEDADNKADEQSTAEQDIVDRVQDDEEESGQNDVATANGTEEDEEQDTGTDTDTDNQEPEDNDDETGQNDPVATDDEADSKDNIDKVITINSGEGSYTVAKKLANVGVITSAENFDNFLCENGYDKRLRTGTFIIPANASDEQIARIVTGRE